MTTYIYVLRDCWTNVRYVGRTSTPLRRFQGHLTKIDTGTHKGKWVARALREGRPIGMSVIAICDGDGSDEERNWIARYKELGACLTNASDGGEGLLNPSVDTRAKMSEAQRRRPAPTAETRKRLSESQRRSYTEARRLRVAEYSRNRPEEVLEKIRYAARNKSPETLDKWRRAVKAAWAAKSPEYYAERGRKIWATRTRNLTAREEGLDAGTVSVAEAAGELCGSGPA